VSAGVLSHVGQENKLVVFPMPPLFVPTDINTSEVSIGDQDVDVKSGNNESDANAESKHEDEDLVEQGTGLNEEKKHPLILDLDFVFVKILLDGESTDNVHQNTTSVNLFSALQLSDEVIDVPKGGAGEGAAITIPISGGCVPTETCLVKLRDVAGVCVECPAQLTITGKTASPQSIQKYYEDKQESLRSDNIVNDNVIEGINEKTDTSDAEGLQDEHSSDVVDGEADGVLVGENIVGLLDTGGRAGELTFECPDISTLEPHVDGKDKFLFVDISLDAGVSYDNSAQPLLQIK
jgi:hypothetical protein